VTLIDRCLDQTSTEVSDILLEKGYFLLKNLFTQNDVQRLKSAADEALNNFKEKEGKINNNSIFINNAFLYNNIFLEVVSNEYICQIVEKSIGERITLTNSSLANVTLIEGNDSGGVFGGTWHTDSRYVQRGKVRLNHGFSYLVIICIDDFKDQNSSTKFVNGSHLFNEKPERVLNEKLYEIKRIDGKAGDVFILDSGIWHKAGEPTQGSRWGLISYYTPWYFKPYYRFSEMFDKEQIKLFTDRQINLMHLTTTPPISQFERMNTYITPESFRNNLDK